MGDLRVGLDVDAGSFIRKSGREVLTPSVRSRNPDPQLNTDRRSSARIGHKEDEI